MNFKPQLDFLNVGTKFKEILGSEVTRTAPVVVTFYVSKWTKQSKIDGSSVTVLDFNLQWIGQLTKGRVQL